MIDLDNIEKLANAASKGNWTPFTKKTTVAVLLDDDAKSSIINWPGFDSSDTGINKQKANARYIAAVQPKAVLELLEKIDAENKAGYNAAVLDIVNFMNDFPCEAETIKEQFLST